MATNHNQVDPSAARDWSRPRQKLRCEWVAFKHTLVVMTRARTFQTTVLLFFWMLWTILIMTGRGVPAQYYSYAGLFLAVYVGLTLLLGIIVGRQWDISLDALEAYGVRLEFSSAGESQDGSQEGQNDDP